MTGYPFELPPATFWSVIVRAVHEPAGVFSRAATAVAPETFVAVRDNQRTPA